MSERKSRGGALAERAAQMQRDYDAQTEQLEKLYQAVPGLHRALSEVDHALSELPGPMAYVKMRTEVVDVLSRRGLLQAELDSLPGRAFWLRVAIVNAHRLALRAEREQNFKQAEKLNEQVSSLNLHLNRLDAQIRELTRARRLQLIDRAEADGQISELQAEQRQVREALKPLLPELRRAQAGFPNDTARRRYGLHLDAEDSEWDRVAKALADEERERCFLECFPRFKPKLWGRIDAPRPELAGEHVAKMIN